MKLFYGWVRFWDRREHGESLALVRILIASVVLWDLAEVARFDLVRALWAPVEEGGIGPATLAEPIAYLYRWLGASTTNAWLLFGAASGAALSLALGLFSRTSALVLFCAYAELARLSPDADRGIDTLLRNVLVLLVFADTGATLSLDARLRTGRFLTDRQVLAWPRYLIVLQLTLLYFSAGLLKQSAHWGLSGGFGALALVLQKPHTAAFDVPYDLLMSIYPLTQLGTAATVYWERAAIALPLMLYLRATRTRGGLLRTWIGRLCVLELWVATGVFFHLALAVVLSLGAFPWGCLALYPAMAAPDTLRHWGSRLGALRLRRARRAAADPQAAQNPVQV